MKITMTKKDVTVTIDITVKEIMKLVSIRDDIVGKEEAPKMFNGKQEDLSFLTGWKLNTIYRGVKIYDTHRDRIGFTLSDFDNYVRLETIELARTYIDNELDKVDKEETPKVYIGSQYDLSHLDNWEMATRYRGVAIYGVNTEWGLTMNEFSDRKRFNTLEALHAWVDNQIDNVDR